MAQTIIAGYDDVWVSAANHNTVKDTSNSSQYRVIQFVIRRVSDGKLFFGYRVESLVSNTNKISLYNNSYPNDVYGKVEVKNASGVTIGSSTGHDRDLSKWRDVPGKYAIMVYALDNYPKANSVRYYGEYDGSELYVSITYNGTSNLGGSFVINETVIAPYLNALPSLTLTSPANNQTLSEGQAIYTGNNDFTIRLTADDADPSDTLEYQIKLNGVIKRDWTPIARNTPVDYTFLKADYTKDRNSFTVTVRDSQGGQTVFNGYLDKVQGLPVNVVSSAYLVSRMSPPVRLNNGWLVACLIDNGIANSSESWMRMYVSKNDGRTWEAKGRWGYTTGSYTLLNSLVTNGQYVYFVFAPTVNSTIRLQRFDPVANTFLDSAAVVVLDSMVQTTINSVTLATTPDKTKLWWAASSKNSTYPNSFNIRAGSVPINADGTLGEPSAVIQFTDLNSTGYDHSYPAIIKNNAGNPIVFWTHNKSGTYFVHLREIVNGSPGAYVTIYDAGSYPQSSPYVIRTPNDRWHVVWHGTDSSDSVNSYIRYSHLKDNSIWSTAKKLVKGKNAVITSDK
ncbi:hypothetical protein X546_24400, partial [Brevibacillus borstelensis cifa_chp40]